MDNIDPTRPIPKGIGLYYGRPGEDIRELDECDISYSLVDPGSGSPVYRKSYQDRHNFMTCNDCGFFHWEEDDCFGPTFLTLEEVKEEVESFVKDMTDQCPEGGWGVITVEE